MQHNGGPLWNLGFQAGTTLIPSEDWAAHCYEGYLQRSDYITTMKIQRTNYIIA